MDIKELEKKFSDLSATVDVMRKDYDLKLDTAQKETASWKENAQKREDEIRILREKTEKAEKDAKEASQKARASEIKAFASELKKNGKITPAQEEMIIKLMESMTSDAAIMTYKEKDGSDRTHNQLSLFKAILQGIKTQVVYGEMTHAGAYSPSAPDSDQETEQFQEVITKGGGRTMLPKSEQALADAAEKYMEDQRVRGIVVSYGDALLAVCPKNKRTV